VITLTIKWHEWNEVNGDRTEYQKANEKNQEVDSRDKVMHIKVND